jgi:hypothetical protein
MLNYETYCTMRGHLGFIGLAVTPTNLALGLDTRNVAKWTEVEQFQPLPYKTPRSSTLNAFKGQIVR